jgi:hypothetical protein
MARGTQFTVGWAMIAIAVIGYFCAFPELAVLLGIEESDARQTAAPGADSPGRPWPRLWVHGSRRPRNLRPIQLHDLPVPTVGDQAAGLGL